MGEFWLQEKKRWGWERKRDKNGRYRERRERKRKKDGAEREIEDGEKGYIEKIGVRDKGE